MIAHALPNNLEGVHFIENRAAAEIGAWLDIETGFSPGEAITEFYLRLFAQRVDKVGFVYGAFITAPAAVARCLRSS